MRAHGDEVLAEEVRVPTVAGPFGAQADGVVVPAGAALAVPVARILRGPAKAQEAMAAMGNPDAAN